jgi:hypothetical protein
VAEDVRSTELIMSKDLLVRMTIPIDPHVFMETDFYMGTAITFHQWLPLASDQSIVVSEDRMSLTFWINMDCVRTVSDVKKDDIPRHSNIAVNRIFADVKITGVPDDLGDFIAHTDYYRRSPDDHTPEEKRLIPEYERLGKQVYVFTLERLNRLLSFVRSYKGQYWLEDYAVDPDQMGSVFTKFKARVKVEDSHWTRWHPTQLGGIIKVGPGGSERYISAEDWLRISEFVTSSGKADLVGELLAGAESLAESGRRRSALTEAVTALEVAVSRFAQQPYANSEFGSKFAKRLNLDSLKNQHARLGLSATANYLLPLLFTEDQMPTDVLNGCQEAIAQRQSVVHQGQRDVNESKLYFYLRSIRAMCSILREYTPG